MRCDELIHIQRKHVHVFDTRMEINIPHRKNDQYNQGHKVYIASSSNDTCPVAITRRYLKVLPQNSEQSLVCPVVLFTSRLCCSKVCNILFSSA